MAIPSRPARGRKPIRRRPGKRIVEGKSLRLADEVRYIQRRAADHDGRIVTVGQLVLFSTETGDAWLLDPADRLAARLAGNKRAIWGISIRRDSVVPLAVEFGAFDIDRGHLGVRDDNAAGVLASVEFAVHSEAGFGGGGRNQIDDHPIADEWLGAPVLADEGEEPVFDFVPLAGAGRQVADRDVEAELVGQLL